MIKKGIPVLLHSRRRDGCRRTSLIKNTSIFNKAAKALFLNEIIDFEKQEQIEIAKAKLILNMALVDGNTGLPKPLHRI